MKDGEGEGRRVREKGVKERAGGRRRGQREMEVDAGGRNNPGGEVDGGPDVNRRPRCRPASVRSDCYTRVTENVL